MGLGVRVRLVPVGAVREHGGDVDEGAADLPHHLLRHPIQHVDVVPAVPVRLARVVDRLGQRPLLDGVLGLRARVRVRVTLSYIGWG